MTPPRGGDCERFEVAFAGLVGARYALAFPYGRSALLLLLEALGLRDCEVITPAITCVVVPHAVVCSGNRPVFVDVEEGGFNMDLALVPPRVTGRTGAIIATSMYGYPCDLDMLEAVRARFPRDIPVIQDCALTLDARWKGRPVHKAGVAACYSLNISKVVSSIFGGVVATDSEALHARLQVLRDERLRPASWGKGLKRLLYLLAILPVFSPPIYALVNKLERSGLLNRFTYPIEEDQVIGMPRDYLEGMAGIEARVGIANLRRFDEVVRRRREAAEVYFQHLNLDGFVLPPRLENSTYSHFVVRVSRRDEWLERCLRRGLQLGQVVPYSVPELPSYGAHRPDEFPRAAQVARTVINLPIWGGRRLAERVVDIVREVHREIEGQV
ncbi:MAG: DegT/DnrJ/EryC1/StrS family aminotransferase [Planctomycetes bacterium]|nr:DegT/DnrJ/EryC1/StrS family aminotransferase [Planctomycetota bacterium]